MHNVVFYYFAMVYAIVAVPVMIFHLRTARSMNLSTLTPLPLPTRVAR